jgi:hypothetical protein
MEIVATGAILGVDPDPLPGKIILTASAYRDGNNKMKGTS